MHLHAVAARGDLDGIRFALSRKIDIDTRDDHGCTALHHALAAAAKRRVGGAPCADLATIEFLLAAGADIHATDQLQHPALHLAADVSDVAFVDLLLNHGADPKHITKSGYTTTVSAAYQAAGPQKLAVLTRLAAAGADLNVSTEYSETPLSVCLRMGDWTALRHLLDAGADPAPLRWTPLHRAVVLGTVDEAAALAANPSAINDPLDRWKHSPWQLAIRRGRADLLDLLADRGADLSATTQNGEGLLHLAAETDSSALPWLLARHADYRLLDNSENTPLHRATEHDSSHAVRALLVVGADYKSANTYGQQPVNLTASTEILSMLAAAGADLDHVDGCGDWPLKNAAQDNDPKRVAWLLAHGVRVDQTSTGATALHAAAQADAREIIAQLLTAGAAVNAQDVDGFTSLFFARSREAVHQLRRAGADPNIADDAGATADRWLKDPLLRAALREPLA